MQNASPCSICQSAHHDAAHCPELYAPLKSGEFVRPSGGRPQGGDDDERAKKVTATAATPPPSQDSNDDIHNNPNNHNNNVHDDPGVLYLL
jgi:hypothetical protein